MLKLSRKARYSLPGRNICNCNGEQQHLAVRQPAKQRRRKNQQMTILVSSVGSFFSYVNDAQAHEPENLRSLWHHSFRYAHCLRVKGTDHHWPHAFDRKRQIALSVKVWKSQEKRQCYTRPAFREGPPVSSWGAVQRIVRESSHKRDSLQCSGV